MPRYAIGLLSFSLCCSLLFVAACRRGSEQEPTTPGGESDDQGSPAPATGQITITAELRDGDQLAITVANGTEGEVELLRGLAIEQLDGDEWVELEAVGEVWIRPSCAPIDDVLFPEGMGDQCFRIAALTQIEVMPWLGTFGDAQCACEQCAQVPAGRYRVVASGCEGERYASEAVAIRLRDEDEDALAPGL